jgi:hypothetical protein
MKDLINSLFEHGLDAGIISMGSVVDAPKAPENFVEEEVKLSAKAFRTLMNAYIAEKMMNESVDDIEELETLGLMEEKKLTSKGKQELYKYLPTIFAS